MRDAGTHRAAPGSAWRRRAGWRACTRAWLPGRSQACGCACSLFSDEHLRDGRNTVQQDTSGSNTVYRRGCSEARAGGAGARWPRARAPRASSRTGPGAAGGSGAARTRAAASRSAGCWPARARAAPTAPPAPRPGCLRAAPAPCRQRCCAADDRGAARRRCRVTQRRGPSATAARPLRLPARGERAHCQLGGVCAGHAGRRSQAVQRARRVRRVRRCLTACPV